jgi:hypothetical protein
MALLPRHLAVLLQNVIDKRNSLSAFPALHVRRFRLPRQRVAQSFPRRTRIPDECARIAPSLLFLASSAFASSSRGERSDFHIRSAKRMPSPAKAILPKPNGRWYFDSDTGAQEILFRQISENEATAIATCRGLFLASRQREGKLSDDDSIDHYARRLI